MMWAIVELLNLSSLIYVLEGPCAHCCARFFVICIIFLLFDPPIIWCSDYLCAMICITCAIKAFHLISSLDLSHEIQ
jgi:hypothetical protein